MEHRQSEGVMYAVFEKENNGYLIYKLDSVEGSGKDDVCELGPPIETLKSSQYPSAMSFFSMGSKLYFCGGFDSDSMSESFPVYKSEAYMLDFNSNQGIVEIPSMNSPKPNPYVFGPVGNHKFYIFSRGIDFGCPSFEMLDTSTNLWEDVTIPDSISQEYYHNSVVCGSNILICNRNHKRKRDCLFVFCTRTGIWRILDERFSIEPCTLPFVKASPLFHGNEFGLFFLAYASSDTWLPQVAAETCLPQVYLSWFLPVVMKDIDLVNHFYCLGEVDGLAMHLNEIPEFLGGWGKLADFFSFNGNRICVVRAGEKGFSEDMCFAIDIFRVSYSVLEGLQAKIIVKVENALRYKYCSKACMDPKYFFVVG